MVAYPCVVYNNPPGVRIGYTKPDDRGEYLLVHLEIIVNNVRHRLGISCRTRATTVDTIMDVCQLVRYTIGLDPRGVPVS
jgi:hypothetical protein